MRRSVTSLGLPPHIAPAHVRGWRRIHLRPEHADRIGAPARDQALGAGELPAPAIDGPAAGSRRGDQRTDGLPAAIAGQRLVRYPVILDILDGLAENLEAFLHLGLAQRDRWRQLEHVRVVADVEHRSPELACTIGHLGAGLAGRLLGSAVRAPARPRSRGRGRAHRRSAGVCSRAGADLPAAPRRARRRWPSGSRPGSCPARRARPRSRPDCRRSW